MPLRRRSHPALARRPTPLLLLVGVLLAACADAPSERKPPTTPEPVVRCPEPAPPAHAPALAPADAPSPELVRRLHERFETIAAIQQAAVVGDQYRSLGLSDSLGDRIPAPDEPETWHAPMQQLHAELEAVELAESPQVVAAGVARLAIVCGDCHRGLPTSVWPPVAPPPTPRTERDTVDAHRWAAQALWDALVDASDERWIHGVTTFEDIMPGCSAATMESDRVAAQQCHDADYVAHRGRNAQTLEGRAAVYGQLLSMCAGCHARAAGRGTPSGPGPK